MTIAALRVTALERRLRIPLRTARGTLTRRRALRVCIEDDAGHTGVGEAAPLPGFGAGCPTAAGRALEAARKRLPGLDLEKARAWVASRAQDPCAAWALDAALVDLGAGRAGLSAAAWLARGTPPASALPVSALLLADTPDSVEAEAAEAAARGERVLKLKVGGGSLRRDVDRVAAARAGAGPRVALRIDANGAWPVEEAQRRLAALGRFGLEFAEQPVAARDLEGLRILRKRSGVAIAADESVRSFEDAARVLAAEAADVLVLKPAALGPLAVTMQITEQARARGVDVVLSSLLDGADSLWAAVHLGAVLACTRACGLATGHVLGEEADAPVGREGWVQVPSGPGLRGGSRPGGPGAQVRP